MAKTLLAPVSVPDDLSQLWTPDQRQRRQARYADMIVMGRVATGLPGQAEAEGLAIADGKIIGIGSASDLEGLKSASTEMVDAGDGVIAPGLVEPHMHLFSSVMVESWIDCSQLENPTVNDVLDRLKESASQTTAGGWVTGKLFDPSLYPGEPDLTLEMLDAVSTDLPVAVLNASMHYLYVNSKAFELAGITAETPDPPSGVFYRADGKLTGKVGESGGILAFISHVPPMSPADAAAGIRGIMNRAASVGVTSIREALTGALMGVAEFGLLHQLNGAARLPVRVSTAQFSKLGNAAWAQAGVTPGAGDDMVRAAAWKIVSDGSNQGRSGYQREPYIETGGVGEPNWEPGELVGFLKEGIDNGWQIMCHANGDAAIDEVLAGYKEALGGKPDPNDRRHRIEHSSIGHHEQFEQMAQLGLSPSFLMNHVYYWGAAFRDHILGPQRAALLDSVATAEKNGLRSSLHSDYSVSPIQPLISARTAVLREVRDGGAVLNADECVSAESALKAITVDAAWQVHADDAGSLEVGKSADFAILSDNPWTADPSTWGDIKTYETRINGTVAWSS